jgi:hypothetical protein
MAPDVHRLIPLLELHIVHFSKIKLDLLPFEQNKKEPHVVFVNL